MGMRNVNADLFKFLENHEQDICKKKDDFGLLEKTFIALFFRRPHVHPRDDIENT